MATETEKWFVQDILKWRQFGGTAWSVMLATALTACHVAGLKFVHAPCDPVSLILATVSVFLSPKSWFFISTGTLFVAQLCKLTASQAKATPTVSKSVLNCVKDSLTNRLLTVIQFWSTGVYITFVMLRLVGLSFANFYKDNDGKQELNITLIYMLIAGGFAAVQEAVSFYYSNGNYQQIPIINLDKYSQVKQILHAQLYPVFISSVHCMKTYFGLFMTCGWLTGLISLQDSYYLLLSLTPLIGVFLVIFHVKTILTCVRVCMSVHCTVPLQQLDLENLLDACASDTDILSLLALQNLSDATNESSDVRRQIFSLSIPGGHPHTWNKLKSVTLANIQKINSELSKLLSPPKVEDSPETTKTANPTSFARSIASPNMRLLAPNRQDKIVCPEEPSPPKWMQNMLNHWDDFVGSLNRRPIIGWLVRQPQDLAFRQVFTKSQACIYSAEILSHVVRASIGEDSYGVVQKDLPAIMTALLKLEEYIDKCRNQASFHRKRYLDPPDVLLKLELKCAVKSAVYRIVMAFKEHILEVPLDQDLAKKVENCLSFLEA